MTLADVTKLSLQEANILLILLRTFYHLLFKKCGKDTTYIYECSIRVFVDDDTYFDFNINSSYVDIKVYDHAHPFITNKLYNYIAKSSVNKYYMYKENRDISWTIFSFGINAGSMTYTLNHLEDSFIEKMDDVRFNIWMPYTFNSDNSVDFSWYVAYKYEAYKNLLEEHYNNFKYKISAKTTYKTTFGLGIEMVTYLLSLISTPSMRFKLYE